MDADDKPTDDGLAEPFRFGIGERLRHLAAGPPLPDPGAGATTDRFAVLTEVSRACLSLGRLYEGHADAVAILHEAAVAVPWGPGAVWASELPEQPVHLEERSHGAVITGRKSFCSGASVVAWALVTVRSEHGVELALVHLDQPSVAVAAVDWVGAGMADTDTRSVCFDGTPVVTTLGGPRWYLERPGFWHGAVGVAACWMGGASGILETMRVNVRDDPHEMALLGAASADAGAMAAVLEQAAVEIDRDPEDRQAAHRRALLVRAVVERGSRSILDHAALALGPRPMAFDRDHSQRVVDLQVYLRQHHGRRDLEALGRVVHAPPGPASC